MQGFDGFHAIAAARGDGLLPQLLNLRKTHALPANVVDLSSLRPPVRMQAGPAALPAQLPDNVLLFPGLLERRKAAPVTDIPRRPRHSRARSLSRKKS